MNDYKPNSNRFKEEKKAMEKKKFDKVVTGKATTRKKTGLNKFAEAFLSEDIHSVISYLGSDVLIPAMKSAIFNTITNGTDMLLYGEAKHADRKSSSDRVSYRRYYDDRDDRRTTRASNVGFQYEDVVVESRGEAEDILSRMDEALDVYGVVSIADLYDLAGLSSEIRHTHNKYGWTSIRNADIVRVRGDNYMIRMPKAMPID